MAVCALFVLGVEHGMCFIRVSSDTAGHYLGEKKTNEIEELANLRS